MRWFFIPVLVSGCQLLQAPAESLGGTSWQLVRFQGSDDTVLLPDDRAKYTVAFAADGSVGVRFDCNRGHGSWKSAGGNQIEFGPVALTRAMCPPGSLHDRIARHWPFVRSYVIRGGHLFLSLMADGGSYQFEPVPAR
jgi:para-nitrobenzyl esterase